jgi:rhamnose utilization protein RhaD (predicted bifunctional aldolase and dehydrogenase)
VTPDTQVIVLENHGLICCASSVADTAALMEDVETRLAMPARDASVNVPTQAAPSGFSWADESWIAQDNRATALAVGGTYYPDHVVFLGPALPTKDHDGSPPAVVRNGHGILIRDDATPSQKAMLRCLSDLLSRLPADWSASPIGADAEAELLKWDAEKYRQALAARS